MGRPIIDTRKGDRHIYPRNRKQKRPYVKQPSKWDRRVIVAWDGEGANLNDENNTHVYSLLANSNGQHILNHEGLSTEDILMFFIDFSNENDINVIYGGSYDVNMILKDLPKDKLQQLWDTGTCQWKYFRLFYATRKKFTVQLISGFKVKKTFVLWDVIGYFQSTFVRACETWLGDLPVLKDIQEMKLKRSEFSAENIEDIIEYNKKECMLLVLLMQHLFESLDEANVKLKRYDGAGSIAAELLRMNGVIKYKGKIPHAVNRWAQYAYSGGRIEAIKCGTTVKPTSIYRYDINSAYPAACLTLPNYVGAKWTRQEYWDDSYNSLVCVKYHFQQDQPFYPLWYRDANGAISYPREGYGVYWGAEIENLYKYYEEGKDFEIEWCLNCELKDDTKPFLFLKDLYELRKQFQAEGSMASESLKLGLNSVYGKLVQQAGYREGRIPTYHQLLWGGQITAYTRARLFDAAMQQPKDIISFATDAVFTTRRLDLDIGKELGQWTMDEFKGITIVQAGVYFLDEGTQWYEKFRGFDKGSLDREQIIKCWETGEEYSATLTRFVGLGSALMATDFNCWRTWRTDSRSLDIRPTGKRISGVRSDFHKGLRVTKPQPNITPTIMSTPYSVVWIDGKKPSELQQVNGVPLETLVDEYEDGGL